MIKNLSIFLLFFSIFCTAQNIESLYLQQEHDRISRVQNHETAIQNYINQNISSYNLPSAVFNKISATLNEDGNVLTGEVLETAIISIKMQNLREQFLNENPNIKNDYTATPLNLATACANNGFENGDTSGFSFFSQKFPSWMIFQNFPTTPIMPQPNSIISLVDNSINDTFIPTMPRVKNGNHAIRLNNSVDGNLDVSSMKREVIVGANQDNITFNYSLVLEDPEHGDSENPYYQCRVKSMNGNIIFERKIVANRNNTNIFKTTQNGNIVYTNWVCESIDVSQYRGQTVILEVFVADCALQGHWGYAYFDNFCGTNCAAPTFGKVTLDPMGITCPILPLTVSGNFITPAGYELDNLTLQVADFDTQVFQNLPNQSLLFGNDFSFTVTGPDLFPYGQTSKKFDFKVIAKFKLIGSSTSTMIVPSQTANEGPDVIFINGTCQICTSCAPVVTVSYPKSLKKGIMRCLAGRLRLPAPVSITLYSAAPGDVLSDGDVLYNDQAMTSPYEPNESQPFLMDTNKSIFFASINGIINFQGQEGESCAD